MLFQQGCTIWRTNLVWILFQIYEGLLEELEKDDKGKREKIEDDKEEKSPDDINILCIVCSNGPMQDSFWHM